MKRSGIHGGQGPHPIDVLVGLRVRLRRKELGMTQGQLAQDIGVSFQQVQKYERGANRLSASMLFEVARALDVPVQWFFEGAPVAERGSASDHPALEFLMSDEGGEILDLFPRIENRALRRRLLQLLRHLAR